MDYVRDKINNIWTIVIKYLSEGAQLKLAEKIKAALQVKYVINNPFKNKTKVLFKKHYFQTRRDMIKALFENSIEDLGPDDVRECGTPPEVSHIMQDDYFTGN